LFSIKNLLSRHQDNTLDVWYLTHEYYHSCWVSDWRCIYFRLL